MKTIKDCEVFRKLLGTVDEALVKNYEERHILYSSTLLETVQDLQVVVLKQELIERTARVAILILVLGTIIGCVLPRISALNLGFVLAVFFGPPALVLFCLIFLSNKNEKVNNYLAPTLDGFETAVKGLNESGTEKKAVTARSINDELVILAHMVLMAERNFDQACASPKKDRRRIIDLGQLYFAQLDKYDKVAWIAEREFGYEADRGEVFDKARLITENLTR